MSTTPKVWNDGDHASFVSDMEAAGREVHYYQGRSFWKGPAVQCDAADLQEVIRETRVKLQWDQLGLGYIVYPLRKGNYT